jgi:hypothetical protein
MVTEDLKLGDVVEHGIRHLRSDLVFGIMAYAGFKMYAGL